jgi:hypothetical protein
MIIYTHNIIRVNRVQYFRPLLGISCLRSTLRFGPIGLSGPIVLFFLHISFSFACLRLSLGIISLCLGGQIICVFLLFCRSILLPFCNVGLPRLLRRFSTSLGVFLLLLPLFVTSLTCSIPVLILSLLLVPPLLLLHLPLFVSLLSTPLPLFVLFLSAPLPKFLVPLSPLILLLCSLFLFLRPSRLHLLLLGRPPFGSLFLFARPGLLHLLLLGSTPFPSLLLFSVPLLLALLALSGSMFNLQL